jgi:hypothetical protein
MAEISDIFWGVGFTLFALLFGGGWAQMNASPPEWSVARLLIWSSLLPAFVADGFWTCQTEASWPLRLLVSGMIGAAIGVTVFEMLRWIDTKERAATVREQDKCIPSTPNADAASDGL